jgi:hypothetical protein
MQPRTGSGIWGYDLNKKAARGGPICFWIVDVYVFNCIMLYIHIYNIYVCIDLYIQYRMWWPWGKNCMRGLTKVAGVRRKDMGRPHLSWRLGMLLCWGSHLHNLGLLELNTTWTGRKVPGQSPDIWGWDACLSKHCSVWFVHGLEQFFFQTHL